MTPKADYTLQLQRALTGLTGGGSEFFTREGDEIRADIPKVMAFLRSRQSIMQERVIRGLRDQRHMLAFIQRQADGGSSEARAFLDQLPKVTDRPFASTAVMETSAGPDFFTMIHCEDRELSLYRFKHRYQSEFTVAELKWLVAGGEKPNLMDYSEKTHPDEVRP